MERDYNEINYKFNHAVSNAMKKITQNRRDEVIEHNTRTQRFTHPLGYVFCIILMLVVFACNSQTFEYNVNSTRCDFVYWDNVNGILTVNVEESRVTITAPQYKAEWKILYFEPTLTTMSGLKIIKFATDQDSIVELKQDKSGYAELCIYKKGITFYYNMLSSHI